MIQILSNFILSSACIHCKEITPNRGLFCDACGICIEYITYHERCSKCYREKTTQICKRCRRFPTPFMKTIILFAKGSPAKSLLKDIEYHQKLLVRIFYERLDHPLNSLEGVSSEKELAPVAKGLASILEMPYYKEPTPKYLLFLSRSGVEKISLICSGLHLQFIES